MTTIREEHIVTDIAQLRAVGGEASSRAAGKTIDRIDGHCARFIAASPFCVIASRGADGLLDLSPKGDPAGFVRVLDERTLLVPDRLGNRRFDSFENLIERPEIAAIFLIPGWNDTLRVAGTARITVDPELLEASAINGRAPQFGLLIDVREAFLHCAKCMVRSDLWTPSGWPATDDVPTMAAAMVDHCAIDGLTVEAMDEIIAKDRTERLY